jgi:hypothetical protein
MHQFGQLQPVASQDGGNRPFLLRCSEAVSGANCFPPASPISRHGPGKQEAPRRALLKQLILLVQTGASEEIRTLDPNLGKTIL